MPDETPGKKRFVSLSTALLAVALVATIVALAIQGRKIAEMERRMIALGSRNAREIQTANMAAKFNVYVNKKFGDMDRRIRTLEAHQQSPTSEGRGSLEQ